MEETQTKLGQDLKIIRFERLHDTLCKLDRLKDELEEMRMDIEAFQIRQQTEEVKGD